MVGRSGGKYVFGFGIIIYDHVGMGKREVGVDHDNGNNWPTVDEEVGIVGRGDRGRMVNISGVAYFS